jgi:glycosyltransferase involved in cell wall biosynthesis
VDAFTRGTKEEFYVVVSRLVPYKRVDAVVEAVRGMPARELVVIGDGPQRAAIEARRPANVRLLGHAPHESLSTTCAVPGPSCSRARRISASRPSRRWPAGRR